MSFLHALILVLSVVVGIIICALIAEWAKSRTVFLICCVVVGLTGGAILEHFNL